MREKIQEDHRSACSSEIVRVPAAKWLPVSKFTISYEAKPYLKRSKRLREEFWPTILSLIIISNIGIHCDCQVTPRGANIAITILIKWKKPILLIAREIKSTLRRHSSNDDRYVLSSGCGMIETQFGSILRRKWETESTLGCPREFSFLLFVIWNKFAFSFD